ncbi:uncharacterized protein MKK02DRAFT_41562 [Dioszegia hungarica]|uniref:Uncharacterized protein n=1 Tax=Dioszegia hungarica TaxID=4972 RepID=A0AA38H0C8_9TREE|nr:uncharacterized protein MKK02DRAFT_41562 [Dioszegia hungarica]KAI9631928.1 hypothetical protein MKK02DRAFT_41562 [Dioszegia hungarica]
MFSGFEAVECAPRNSTADPRSGGSSSHLSPTPTLVTPPDKAKRKHKPAPVPWGYKLHPSGKGYYRVATPQQLQAHGGGSRRRGKDGYVGGATGGWGGGDGGCGDGGGGGGSGGGDGGS